jgi:methionyl-tRNA formyltransferase
MLHRVEIKLRSPPLEADANRVSLLSHKLKLNSRPVSMREKKDLKIVFFGTPEFAVSSLKAIIDNGFNVVAVVTSPDKPAGRGYKLQESAVKKAALEYGLPVLQPLKLKSPEFAAELKTFEADIQIVIAFRMLPESIWSMPPMGTFNLHASYLPYYRGAAPINRVIMNGETETGVSTFFLKHEIDTGNLILQEKTPILPDDNAGTLHDKLMQQGARLVVRSLETILTGQYTLLPQAQGDFPHAPKIFTEDCLIHWDWQAERIHNQIRGLSPYPAAFTYFQDKKLKIFASEILPETSSSTGQIEIRGNQLLAHAADHVVNLTDVQMEGKKRMAAKDFINGLKINH